MRPVGLYTLGLLNNASATEDLGLVDRVSGNAMLIQQGKVLADC